MCAPERGATAQRQRGTGGVDRQHGKCSCNNKSSHNTLLNAEILDGITVLHNRQHEKIKMFF